MTKAEELAQFVVDAKFEMLSPDSVEQLKLRVLDSLACAFAAIPAEPVQKIREQLINFGSVERKGKASLIGAGMSAPDRAAFYNGALIRYLDFNDSYLSKGETCHPSDNVSAVLAAAESGGVSGREFLTALAVSYQVQCRLSDEAPVRARGFDHTAQGTFAVAAGVSRALVLNEHQTSHALAIAGTAFQALRVTRTGALSHWKGLAYPNMAFGVTHAVFLAMRGVTGPLEVFEGNKGFMESISGNFSIDWQKERLDRVNRTIIKKYNAEIHSQSTIEGVLELMAEYSFDAKDVAQLDVFIFDVAFHIIGGGEEGIKTNVRTKEEADHSLNYILAAALLDGTVMPDQYRPERIQRKDIQDLLRKIKVHEDRELSGRFPEEMPCRLRVTLKDGREFEHQKSDYEGFHTRPMSWDDVAKKFGKLTERYEHPFQCAEVAERVMELDEMTIPDFMSLVRHGVPEVRPKNFKHGAEPLKNILSRPAEPEEELLP